MAAAVSDGDGADTLAGFLIAAAGELEEFDPQDAARLRRPLDAALLRAATAGDDGNQAAGGSTTHAAAQKRQQHRVVQILVLAVAPPFRRRGVARRLMRQARMFAAG